jgi:Cu/Ag efflux protein CusF
MRNRAVIAIAAFAFLLGAASLYADRDRPHEGKITRIDRDARVLTVQGEKGDQWDLYWTETTKLKGDVTIEELHEGDSVHFDYVDRDGRMWLTELHRTHRAEH